MRGTGSDDSAVAGREWLQGRRAPFLVGAEVGSGLVALAAERGRADFLVASSAGRMRAMGLPSIGCMLPFTASNEAVVDFVEHELLRPTRTPIFAGLCPFEGRKRVDQRIASLNHARINGIANSPSAVHYPDDVADALEAEGIGFSAELGMLERARGLGLLTLAYARTRGQAERAARIRPDVLCVDFGWHAGPSGDGGSGQGAVALDEVILLARDVVRILHKQSPSTICLIQGEPVRQPREVAEICAEAGIEGYIGGSVIDQGPVENAVVDTTLGFKSAAVSHRRERGERSSLLTAAASVGLHGDSDALVDCLRRLQVLADGSAPVVISGPPGTQRHAGLAFLQREAGVGEAATTLLVSDHTEAQLGIRLFGHGDKGTGLLIECDGAPLVIETLEGLSHRWQRKLARLLSRGMVTPFRGNRAIPTRPWVLLLAERPLRELHADGTLVPELLEQLRTREVRMPSLDERLDGLAETLAGHCAERGVELYFTDSAIALLQQRSWAGNMLELNQLIDRVHAAGFRGEISASVLEPLLGPEDPGQARAAGRGSTETEEARWLLAGLRKNAFNRSATARALGISRKTLYNRMRRLGL